MIFDCSTWGKNTFSLHFLCEHDQVHFTEHSGYGIADPGSLLRAAGPVIGMVAKVVAGTTMAFTGSVPPSWFTDVMDRLGNRPTAYLEKLCDTLDQVAEFKNTNYEIILPEIRGPALREIEGIQHFHERSLIL